MTIFWPLSRQQVLDANGKPRLDVSAQFFEAGTTTPRPVYTSQNLITPLDQPVVPGADGRFPRVYMAAGQYAERVSSASAGQLWLDDFLGAPVVPVVPPVTPTVPPASAYFGTGDVKWRLDGGVLPGWVRLNGRSIGPSGSTASERANDDTIDLYKLIWASFNDEIAPVTGGRGNSAQGDWSVGKPITPPDMRGRGPVGLDEMGATPAGTIQTVLSLNLTAGSTKATVGNADRLAIGMTIFATGVSKGTTIQDILNVTLTLSAPAVSDGTVSAQFAFVDAGRPGAAGGDMLRVLTNRNLPANLPAAKVTVPYPSQGYVKATGTDGVAAAGSGIQGLLYGATTGQTAPPADKQLDVPFVNGGGGVAVPSAAPCRVGTWHIKL